MRLLLFLPHACVHLRDHAPLLLYALLRDHHAHLHVHVPQHAPLRHVHALQHDVPQHRVPQQKQWHCAEILRDRRDRVLPR